MNRWNERESSPAHGPGIPAQGSLAQNSLDWKQSTNQTVHTTVFNLNKLLNENYWSLSAIESWKLEKAWENDNTFPSLLSRLFISPQFRVNKEMCRGLRACDVAFCHVNILSPTKRQHLRSDLTKKSNLIR